METDDKAVLSTTTSNERCALTEAEKVAKGIRLAGLVQDLVNMRELHKEERAAMKKAEDALQREVLEVREDVATGSEHRDVPCEWVAIWPINEAHLIRTDTNEVVRFRELEDHERQLRIVPIDPPKKRRPGKTVTDLDDDLPPAV